MRKVYLMMLLTVVCNSAMAELVAVVSNETVTTYADTASIRKTGNKVEMWLLDDYKMIHRSKRGTPFMSRKVQGEYDCMAKLSRILYTFAYSGNMGAGAGAYYDPVPSPWGPVSTGSVGEIEWKFACGKK